MGMLTWKNGQYLLNGQPYRIISGAIHYFRVVPGYWEDRLLKLKACGFNTVETYIAWNVHEPKEGEFNFSGIADVVSFIELAGKLGLHVIVRPSPFICAEWEFGGLPGWLLGYGEVRLRCSDPLYLSKVDHYYDELIPRLVPLLSTHGGPILAVQVENEYGSYGNDHAYLEYLRAGLVRRGVDVLLFTSDGPTDEMLLGGSLDDVHATVNFGSRVEESFRKYREYRTEEPLMVMEFWNGWFDHWMEDHHVRDAADVAGVLDEMLEKGSSINMYMFHGGTNFSFYSGANHIQTYEPTTTSYDYDAPLTEWGIRRRNTRRSGWCSASMVLRRVVCSRSPFLRQLTERWLYLKRPVYLRKPIYSISQNRYKAYASSRWKNSDSPMVLYCTAHLFRDRGKDSSCIFKRSEIAPRYFWTVGRLA